MRVNSASGGYDELTRYVGTKYDVSDQLNYMNARYQDRARGKFISEDPMFRSPDTMDLSDPQSMNSYSYAENNPIVKSDPSGKCPWCLIPIAVAVGAAGGVVQQGLTDLTTNLGNNGLNVKNYQWSPIKDYLYSAGAGGALGFALSGGALLGVGAAGIASIAGGGTIVSDVIRAQYVDHTPIDPYQIGFDAITTAATAGLIEATPKVPGRLPNLFTDAFFTGSHTTSEVLKGVAGTVAGGVSNGAYNSLMQGNALNQLVSAFAPSNSIQAQALSQVYSAFAGH